MTLLVDVGNSAVKWMPLRADAAPYAAQRQLHRGVVDIAARLIDQWQGNVTPGAAVIACNVAGPEVTAAVEAAARALQLRPVRWLGTQRRFAGAIVLENGYRDPLQLGADRWHCMLGACTTFSTRPLTSFIVVNAGTATTVDCVEVRNENAKFIGGVIVPGVRTMLESLARQTAGLPSADITALPAADFPDHTDAAIVTGVLDAQAGGVELIRRRFATRLRTEPHLILTGGYAETLSARLSSAAGIDHNLVLRGLALRVRSEEAG